MKSNFLKSTALVTVILSLSGCVGSNAVTEALMGFNVKAVDNRYARGGLNILLSPVYGITIAADYLVFNSLEFWTGKNPLNDKPHIFDTKVDTMLDINKELDESFTEAPIGPLTNIRSIQQGQIIRIDENTFQMDIIYNTGETAELLGFRDGEIIQYYFDGELVASTTMAELQDYPISAQVSQTR